MTVGIEEELMLLDPSTLDLAPRAGELLERVAGDPRFKLELPASQFEIVSPPLRSAGEAARFLERARADLAGAADGLVRIACAGVHPFAAPEGEINALERYRHMPARYGRIARRQLVHALQVHVAVGDPDRALAVYNALRSYLPELTALAANAPFYAGEDTGLATVRPKICELLPRQGVPPAFATWAELDRELHWGRRSGALPDARVWWWELRPRPALGTVEVRVPDAQTTVAEAAAVVAVVHALVAWLAACHEAGEALPVAPTWRIEENRWRALSRGLEGELVDLETGATMPARERLHALIDAIADADSGSEPELALARELVERGGAERQREQAEHSGLRGLTGWLADRFRDPLPTTAAERDTRVPRRQPGH